MKKEPIAEVLKAANTALAHFIEAWLKKQPAGPAPVDVLEVLHQINLHLGELQPGQTPGCSSWVCGVLATTWEAEPPPPGRKINFREFL